VDRRAIGRLFWVGFRGTSLTDELREMIDDLNPSGLILFSRNIQDPFQTAALTHDLQRHALETRSEGLFIGVDQEGGRVRRLNTPFTVFPPALDLALSDHPNDAVRSFGSITAHELKLVGFNTNFVPVLDILGPACDPGSSVIGDRSYGHDPQSVASMGKIVIEAMRSEGIIPCCKHFPGHGGTLVDSHIDLPVDHRSVDQIENCDLVPFKVAVDMQVDMVMTAHVLFPALDPFFPATLSPAVISGMLRTRIGYQGIVITDDLDMGAVASHYSSEESALMAFSAGADLLLICNSPEKAFSARSRIMEALRDGEIPPERLEESLGRIRRLRKKYVASMEPCNQSSVMDYFGSKLSTRMAVNSNQAGMPDLEPLR